MGRRAVAIAALGLSMLSLLSAGAGQHFGIAPGDEVGIPSTPPPGPNADVAGGPNVELQFFSGHGLEVSDGGGIEAFLNAGWVTVTTPKGTDTGCLRNASDRPAVIEDPLLGQAVLNAQVPSARYVGGVIEIHVTFDGTGTVGSYYPLIVPPAQIDHWNADILLLRQAHATGTVTSSAVGGGSIDTSGTIGHGASIYLNDDPNCRT